MTDGDDRGGDTPSLAAQAVVLLRRLRGLAGFPGSYRPALAILACTPATVALLASLLAAREDHRAAAAARDGRLRIAAYETARSFERRRSELEPFVRVTPVTVQLTGILAIVPDDASLHAVSRDARGVVRAEVDSPDPDLVSSAIRSAPARDRWHVVGQAITAGRGVRVTLERPQ